MDRAGLPPSLRVSDAQRDRSAYRRDLWPRTVLDLAHGGLLPEVPELVAWPSNEAEVKACLAWASEREMRVAVWGAGSGVCGALAGAPGVLALDLKRMNALGPVDPERQVVRVGPGPIGQHFEDALALQGWCARHSPSSIGCSTVGGWAASRSSGQFSSRYGSFADMVEGMRVVAPAGAFGTGSLRGAADVPPADAADLHAWVLGAESRLGVITELEVAVHPRPEARRLRGWRFGSFEAALEAVREVLQAGLLPAVMRLYDPVDTKIAGKGSTTRAKGSGWLKQLAAAVESIPGVRERSLALPLALPRLLNGLARGISSGSVLISGWEGDSSEVQARGEAGEAILRSRGGEALGEGPGEHWYAHRHDVSYKLAPVIERGGFADTMEVAATWSRLPGLYAGVREALGRHALVMAHFSHAWREGCSIYFTFAGVGTLDVYDAAWTEALAAAAEAGGTVAHHHGVGRLKARAVARENAAGLPLLRSLAAALDPQGVIAAPPLPEPGWLPPVVPPPRSIDVVSRIATLPADEPAPSRDAWLRAQGWRLLHPCEGPLGTHHPRKVKAPATAILGGVVRTPDGLVSLVDTPRSGSGPDPRAGLPPEAWVCMTVPVERLEGA